MKIFAIVVTYNGKKWYDRCLGSLRDSETPVETIVIDNASSDDTVEYIKNHFPKVHLIESKENLGFAKANNIGIRYAIDHDADYVFLLNQDAWVEKNTLTKLVQTFEDNENVGIASPIHLNGSYTDIDFAFGNCLPSKCISDLYYNRDVPYYEVPFVNAAAWLLSSECIKKVGGFDTLLFRHYGEDNNYCQRLSYHNLRVYVNMHCTICHDRESRKDAIGQNPLWNQVNERIDLRVNMGNINKEINMADRIKKAKRKRLQCSILLSKSRVKKYGELIANYCLIEESREKNKKMGMNWL